MKYAVREEPVRKTVATSYFSKAVISGLSLKMGDYLPMASSPKMFGSDPRGDCPRLFSPASSHAPDGVIRKSLWTTCLLTGGFRRVGGGRWTILVRRRDTFTYERGNLHSSFIHVQGGTFNSCNSKTNVPAQECARPEDVSLKLWNGVRSGLKSHPYWLPVGGKLHLNFIRCRWRPHIYPHVASSNFLWSLRVERSKSPCNIRLPSWAGKGQCRSEVLLRIPDLVRCACRFCGKSWSSWRFSIDSCNP